MGLFERLHAGIDWLREAPPIEALRRRKYERAYFEAGRGRFFGEFARYDEAKARVPLNKDSYFHTANTSVYESLAVLDHYDYPSLFWIGDSLRSGARSVVDLGGGVGTKYLAFRKVLEFAQDVDWLVIDVPGAVAVGRLLASERGTPNVPRFSDQWQDADGVDILFVSGCLQYLPLTLAQMLATYTRPPGRIIVNTTPLHATRSYFTIDRVGPSYLPYRVQARDEFVTSVVSAGYRVVDQWLNFGKSLHVPFERGLDIEHYSGLCFDRVR
jgi:putative methyltransferase (TIGR04325 family)